jgi:pimeloyl-ACP methyl ester carboxylesterase
VGTSGGRLRRARSRSALGARPLARAAVWCLMVALCGAPPAARAAQPGAKHSQSPSDFGLAFEEVGFPAADSVRVSGWWFQGPKDAPVVVVAARSTGTMADMLFGVKEFLARGFDVLAFDYRGFGPGNDDAARDTLQYVVFDSKWVDDMVGALRYARGRGGAHVFAWGQDVGGAVALAAAARERSNCDALAVEGLFRTSQDVLLANGTSVIADVPLRHRRIVEQPDEPFSAVARLQVPLFTVLAGRDSVTAPADTKKIAKIGRAHV